MNFSELDGLTSEESKAKADQAKANKRAEMASLAQAYARLFKTDDGQKVLADLTSSFIYSNDVDFSAKNIDYEAAYKNGERGCVKYIIKLMQLAEVV